MNKTEINQINKRALPKFLLMMIISMLIGGIIGFCAAKYGFNTLADSMKNASAFFGAYIAPWIMLTIAVVVPATCVPIYRSTKNMLSSWDEEDEKILEAVDEKLSVLIWITNTALVFSYFLIAASYSGGFAAFDSNERTIAFVIGIVSFFCILFESIIIQQKCVDAAKQINPEKKASIYDMKFHKKWIDDCDEAEKIMIGKCAYKAYSATNIVCTVLSTMLAIGALVFDIGFLPSLTVCLIWIVNLSAYCKEAIRYSKTGNKLS